MPCVLQTVENFHNRYMEIYNTSDDDDGSEDDSDLILRSFTDDPDIPLNQIKVQCAWCKTNTVVLVQIHHLIRLAAY